MLVLLVLITVAILMLRESKFAPSEAKTPMLEPITDKCLDRIEIKHNTCARQEDCFVTLEKQDSKWHLKRPISYPANEKMVETMREALAGMKTSSPVSNSKDRLENFELQQGRGIDVRVFCGDKALSALTIGRAKLEITYVKKQGSDAVFQTDNYMRSVFNKTAKMLRDTNIYNFERPQITRVKYTNQGKELTLLNKSSPGALIFEPLGEKIKNYNSQHALISIGVLAKLNARGFVDEPVDVSVSGLDEKAARVEFDVSENGGTKTIVLLIGNENEKMRQTYVRSSSSDQVFLISSHFVNALTLDAEQLARTDAQVAEEEEYRRKAAEHAHQHHHH